MINMLKKFINTGTVTEYYDEEAIPSRFRGEVMLADTKCENCRTCVTVCPTNAITMTATAISINHKACIFCGRCVDCCPMEQLRHTGNDKLATLSGSLGAQAEVTLKKKIQTMFGRSLHIRHVDVGSCNACDFEMSALSNPIYDLQQYGIDFVASPRHADLLMVTGVVTRNLTQALLMTYEATPAPKMVMAVGACATSGQVFSNSYAVRGNVDTILPVDVYVPGCPPRPQALLYGLLLAINKLKK